MSKPLPPEFFDAAERLISAEDDISPPPPGALAQFNEDFGDWKLVPRADDFNGFGDFGRNGRPEPSVTYHELSEGELSAMRQGANIVRVGVGPQPFNVSTFPAASRVVADDTNYAALPPEGRDAFTGGDAVADFGDRFSLELLRETVARLDVTPFSARPLIMSPRLAKMCREAFPGVDVVETERLPCDEFTRHRDRPRWLRLGLRRAKAKAKRAKMRAARYAARWEQAHLRGGKS